MLDRVVALVRDSDDVLDSFLRQAPEHRFTPRESRHFLLPPSAISDECLRSPGRAANIESLRLRAACEVKTPIEFFLLTLHH
jgi:hypothetical protein